MQSSILYGGSTALPSVRGHFRRPRIDKLIEELTDRHVIVVTAGAGYGKTHALSAYLQNTGRRVCWFQMSGLDNNLSRFWEAFLYGIEEQNKKAASQIISMTMPEP